MSAEPLDARADWLSYAMVATVLFALWRTANDGALWISVPLYLALGGLIVTRGRWRVKLHLLAVVALLAPVGLLFATTEITEIKGAQRPVAPRSALGPGSSRRRPEQSRKEV